MVWSYKRMRQQYVIVSSPAPCSRQSVCMCGILFSDWISKLLRTRHHCSVVNWLLFPHEHILLTYDGQRLLSCTDFWECFCCHSGWSLLKCRSVKQKLSYDLRRQVSSTKLPSTLQHNWPIVWVLECVLGISLVDVSVPHSFSKGQGSALTSTLLAVHNFATCTMYVSWSSASLFLPWVSPVDSWTRMFEQVWILITEITAEETVSVGVILLPHDPLVWHLGVSP